MAWSCKKEGDEAGDEVNDVVDQADGDNDVGVERNRNKEFVSEQNIRHTGLGLQVISVKTDQKEAGRICLCAFISES